MSLILDGTTGVPVTTVTGTLPVANGGTGRVTLTANYVLLGNTTTAMQMIAPGTATNVLASDGTTWASTAAAAVKAKVITFTRDLSLTGAVSYTGVGFRPTALYAIAMKNTTTQISHGFTDGTDQYLVVTYTTGTWTYGSHLIRWTASLSVTETFGAFTSFEADGFTLTYSITGSPTGTGDVRILAIR